MLENSSKIVEFTEIFSVFFFFFSFSFEINEIIDEINKHVGSLMKLRKIFKSKIEVKRVIN